jgi:hypothetical protein
MEISKNASKNFKKKYLNILEEISKESDCYGGYCIFRTILEGMIIEPRVLIQIKCVEKFKYEQSVSQNKDIGWEEAFVKWVDLGHAKKFADIYDENKTISILYKEIMS